MAELSLKVHDYKRKKGSNQAVLLRITPYVRIRSGMDDPPVFIQGGKFFAEGGEEFDKDELPDWVPAEISKMSDSAKREAGLIK